MYSIRLFQDQDMPALVRIWNESVEKNEVVFYPASEEYLKSAFLTFPTK